MTRKTCNICGEARALDEFPRDRRNKDGRDGRCMSCLRSVTRTTYRPTWRRKNRAAYNAQMVRYYRKTGSIPEDELPPPCERRRWAPDEDRIILAPNRPTDAVLGQSLGRSAKAVTIRRSRLMKPHANHP